MNELQRVLLEQLCEIDKVCEKYQIPYTLQGGTLLGAIREKGFIPWDDDIDVAMTREAYERFKQVFDAESTLCMSREGYTAGALQIFFKEREGVRASATSDIFVYDYITSNRLLRKIRIYMIIFLQAMLKTKDTIQFTQASEHGTVKTVIYKAAYRLGCLFPAEKKAKWYRWFCEHALCGEKKDIHLSNDSARFLHRCIPADYMQEYERVEFEGHRFMVSAQYKKILKLSYGEDYMTPKRDDIVSVRHERFRQAFLDGIRKE